MHEIELPGLNGANLLGYLAALGALRVLTVAEPEAEARMSWVDKGWWMPVLYHSRIGSGEELIAALASRVCGEATINPAWLIGKDLTLPRTEYARQLRNLVSDGSSTQREIAGFLSAFGSEALGSGSKNELMSDTEFRTMSGAGHQHFLGFMQELARITEAEHLKSTLLEPWEYADDRPSMRWDPADYRPHALRAEDPSGDPIRTMRGANRLAIEALPLFPTVPQKRRLGTIAFADRNRQTEVSWPIWTDPLDASTVASVLASEEVQTVDRPALARRSIAQVYRARRFTDGKYRNFTPAKAVI